MECTPPPPLGQGYGGRRPTFINKYVFYHCIVYSRSIILFASRGADVVHDPCRPEVWGEEDHGFLSQSGGSRRHVGVLSSVWSIFRRPLHHWADRDGEFCTSEIPCCDRADQEIGSGMDRTIRIRWLHARQRKHHERLRNLRNGDILLST